MTLVSRGSLVLYLAISLKRLMETSTDFCMRSDTTCSGCR